MQKQKQEQYCATLTRMAAALINHQQPWDCEDAVDNLMDAFGHLEFIERLACDKVALTERDIEGIKLSAKSEDMPSEPTPEATIRLLIKLAKRLLAVTANMIVSDPDIWQPTTRPEA